jgi:hypothetical protein
MPPPSACTRVNQLVVQSGQTYDNYCVSNPAGSCVMVNNVSDVILQNLKVGPCEGRGIDINQSTNVTVRTSLISVDKANPGPEYGCPEIDVHNNIFVTDSHTIWINFNTISRGESNIQVHRTNDVWITNNTLSDPIGESCWRQTQIQVAQYPVPNGPYDRFLSNNIHVIGNKMFCNIAAGCRVTDSLNFIGSMGIWAEDNEIQGGILDYGCGFIADLGNYQGTFKNNRITYASNCAWGIADGGGHLVEGNVASNCYNNTWQQACTYVWNPYSTQPQNYPEYGPDCGPVSVLNNIVLGSPAPFWYGGGCDVLTQSGNSWN